MLAKVPHEVAKFLDLPDLSLLQKDLGNFCCRCRVLYGAIGGLFWLEKRVNVPGVHLFQQARHLGHGKQAWGV